jgi:hypothetical protein
MANTLFDRSVFVQENRYIREIASLEDTFDLLDEWPAEQRGLAYETLLNACRQAYLGKFPVAAIRENLQRFLRKSGMLADVGDLPNFKAVMGNRSIGAQRQSR